MVEKIYNSKKNRDDISIKIIDWGTGILSHPEDFLSQRIGSLDYAAPEVFDKKYNSKADVWSCGIILFLLLGGYLPFG